MGKMPVLELVRRRPQGLVHRHTDQCRPDCTAGLVHPVRARRLSAIPPARYLIQPTLMVRQALRHWPRVSFLRKLQWDALDRPEYAYGTYHAALQARALGQDAITVVEFGVGAGHGLIALESYAATVAQLVGVRIEVYGFDMGTGMPHPLDYRDLPYLWKPGFFKMDVEKLRQRLQAAELILGDVALTVPPFLRRPRLPPIGFAAVDVDFYSSTMAALMAFDGTPARLLPRVFCYFDDIIGSDLELHSPYAGELLAIREFNADHPLRKIAPIHGLSHKRLVSAPWHDQLFVLHAFDHPQYTTHIGPPDWQTALPD
jgi:hypothetical protein